MNYTLQRDNVDFRDIVFQADPTLVLPSKVDLRPLCSSVENQGHLGSCTGNAIAGAIEYLENKQSQTFVDLSRLFVYYNERLMEGTIDKDYGACIRDGIKSIVEIGICREDLHPYSTENFANRPSAEAYAEAQTRKITQYARINTLDDMKACLAGGNVFVFGFTVMESFETPEVAATGRMIMPLPTDKSLGGHAVLAVGYDDDTQTIIVRNSWGPEWGADGYFHMPYAYISDAFLASDHWMIAK